MLTIFDIVNFCYKPVMGKTEDLLAAVLLLWSASYASAKNIEREGFIQSRAIIQLLWSNLRLLLALSR